MSKEVYTIDVVYKCFYWYSGKYSVTINEGLSTIEIDLELGEGIQKVDGLIKRLKIDLIDFKTRDIVSKETVNIRELLVAKAFAHGDEFDESPPGEIADTPTNC
ncbi:His-Xaa-Ser system protein HxsD [Cytophaga sp. FL35]|uniref:His-Xaa-Ser system protein HxsD n=1 Tax=Cytophaga sp. FL35 TaxID=1904456 RepID=UPI00165381A8|nr:His-Xaa-Ser system protein HxsD [Cytophaga sp. FL35]MBC7000608.1 His-Xaa-Ser system protein HxsD [Cytophaga sp. FL35]